MNTWTARHRSILDFALSSLVRRKGKNLALLGVYTLVIFVIVSVMFFTDGMKREAGLLLQDAPDLVVQRLVAGRYEPAPAAYAGKIRTIRGVRSARPRLWGYYYDRTTRANLTVVAAEPGALPPESVRVGEGVARLLDLKKGDMVPLLSYRDGLQIFSVDTVFPHASALVSSDLIEMTPEDFRRFFRYDQNLATDIAVRVANAKEIPTVAKKITELFPEARVVQREEIIRTYYAIFDWRSGMLLAMLTGAVLAFVIFAWEKGAGLSADDRREIGILKGIGWETSDVLALKAWEGIVVSLTAYLVGTILAWLHVFVLSAPLLEPMLKGWAVLYPKFRLNPQVSPYILFVLFFLTVLPYVAATIVPSWQAATTDPDAVMRG